LPPIQTNLRRQFFYISFITAIVCVFSNTPLYAQYKVRGYVYDSTRTYPVQAVSVISTGGKGAITNANGYYEVEVSEKDSIWFSYLGKPTVKFPVLSMQNPLSFDISLQINIPVLAEVKVRPRNYKLDSLQNRIDYAKIFNYQKPKLRPSVTTNGVGFDVNEIINMFRFKRNKSLASFQQRLIQEERDKFIDHRFSKALIRRLTQLSGNDLDSFIRLFRPSYTFTKLAGEYDFQLYIKESFYRFKNGLAPFSFLRPEEDDDE
jgi:hypothetical protein